jgi:hypothetical protein
MSKFKTVSAAGKMVSATGTLHILSEVVGWKQKVELWLLNSKVNRNNWKYINLEQHKDLFAETPILVAYVGDKIGDGHNFEEVKNADGSVTASFMASTAERIVGYFKSASDIRIEEKDGQKWIVGVGYIWKWYAQELVKKLKRQGLEGMSVSIETLIDEMYTEGTTEVFTKYQVLGTTVLGDDVSPAVESANIRALSAIGRKEVREMTLRVASENEKSPKNNPQTKTRKGETKTMKLKELQPKFNGFTVVAVDGERVALLSDKGVPHLSTAKKDGDDYIIGTKDEVKANATFQDGENGIVIPVEAITEAYIARCSELEEKLAKATAVNSAKDEIITKMQNTEKARRKNAVKEAIKNRLNQINANSEDEIEEDACNTLLTDEKVEEYACMEDKDGNFCGDVAACKDVDSICMNRRIEKNKIKANASKSKFAWEADGAGASNKDDGIEATVSRLNAATN